jgi:hypothetical protein
MQTNLVVLLLFAGLGCTSERTESKRRDRDEETEQIQHLLEIVHPVMLSLCETRAAEREIEMISYELVKDHSTGLITIGNFQAEEFFPIASRADYLRLAGEIYSMRCPTPTPIDKRCSGIDHCVQQKRVNVTMTFFVGGMWTLRRSKEYVRCLRLWRPIRRSYLE